MLKKKLIYYVYILIFHFLLCSYAESSSEFVISSNHKNRTKIVIIGSASDKTHSISLVLAHYLKRIFDTSFPIGFGNGDQGIFLGVLQGNDLSNLKDKINDDFYFNSMNQRERYIIKSHPKGIYIIGTTEVALENAIWDFLYRLGYRQFFPGPKWEIVPDHSDLAINLEVDEDPDYISRRIWYRHGTWDYNNKYYLEWCRRNRVRHEAFLVNTGHVYNRIIELYQSEFEAHPEYICPQNLAKGTNKNKKLRLLIPGVRRLIINYAIEYFSKNPLSDSVSVEPSDSDNWCYSDSISDLVLSTANEVAKSIEEKFNNKYISFYAYNSHRYPPLKTKAHSKIIVNFAINNNNLPYFKELIEGWKSMGLKNVGIREYYSVFNDDQDLPGQSRSSNLDYLKKSIIFFHNLGAKYITIESSDNWGPNGLSYYIASRLLWNVNDEKHLDIIIDDFLTQSFGPARGPMVRFYTLINGVNKPVLSQDLVGRMYRLLEEATKLTDDPKIQARLDDLTLYTRYVELFRAYQTAQGAERQHAFEHVIRHAYRMRRTMMIHTKGLYRDLVRRDKSVVIPAGAAWDVPEPQNPWKSSEPFTAAELQKMRDEGIARNALLTWTAVTYSQRLVPASIGNHGTP